MNFLFLFMDFFDRITSKIEALKGAYLLSKIGKQGRSCKIKGGGVIIAPENIILGDSVRIGEGAFIVAKGGISIGSYTVISRNCVIQTQTHEYESNLLPYGKEMLRKPVKIGEAVWIGMNVTILPGISIGDGAIIGMGAVVTKDVESCAICVGSPAVVKKYRNKDNFDILKSSGKYIYAAR